MAITDRLLQLLKELKRDIIEGYTYKDVELESNQGNSYRCETFIYENGQVLYFCSEYARGEYYQGGSILFDNPEEFLKAPMEEIIEQINSAYYYNALPVTD